MAFLSQLRDLTIPVLIQRGNLKFTLDVAVEKFTPEEGEYANLRANYTELVLRKQTLQLRVNDHVQDCALAANLTALRQELIAAKAEAIAGENPKAGTLRNARREADQAITEADVDAEFERRIADLEAAGEKLKEELAEADRAIQHNYAERLAYLVAGADIYHDGTEKPVLSGAVEKTPEQYAADVEFFYKKFSVKLLDYCLRKAEQAVEGPLDEGGTSGK